MTVKRKRNRVKVRGLMTVAVVLFMILGAAGCGTRETDESIKVLKRSEKQKPNRQENDEEESIGEDSSEKKIKPPPKGWIKRAYFSPQKNKKGRTLKIKVETIVPKTEDQYFSYVYWKNGRKIGEGEEDTLDPSVYKKGDIIFADVLLHQEDQTLEKKRSEMLMVPNTSPVIKEVKIPSIMGPGTYRITVKAEDIDGDKLTYSLLPASGAASLPEGSKLQIDPATGTVTCTLGEKPPPRQLKFIITADDGDKGTAKKAVTISFKIHKSPEKEPEETEEENLNETFQ